MAKKRSIPLKVTPEFIDIIRRKQDNIQKELMRRAGYKMKKPTLADTQRYLALELKEKGIKFDIRNWERIINGN